MPRNPRVNLTDRMDFASIAIEMEENRADARERCPGNDLRRHEVKLGQEFQFNAPIWRIFQHLLPFLTFPDCAFGQGPALIEYRFVYQVTPGT
jgi:hypothetical protein